MKLAIIGAGFMGKIIAEQARELHVETHCFAWEQGAVAKEAVDYFYPISVTEREEILKKCMAIGIDGVIGSASVTLETAAYIAEEMGLNGNPLRIALEIKDKYRNRRLTESIEELGRVRVKKVTCAEDLEGLSLPIILKPSKAGGKAGLTVIENKEDMEAAFRYAVESGYEEFVAEEYIRGGKEYSVESLTYRGRNYILQVTDKVSGGPPHCVELAHHQPANLSPVLRKRVEIAVDKILTALGIENGPCHTEIKIVDDVIYLIEVNGRMGGGHISHPLVELSTGYPYVKGVIQVALDCFEGLDTEKLLSRYASVFFVTEQTKNLKPIFDQCESYPWCYTKHEATKTLQPLIKNDGYRINYFIYYSPDEPPSF